jgi:hypothetical protein
MKVSRITNAVGYIDDDLISGAEKETATKRTPWIKWGTMAACLCLVFVVAGSVFGLVPSIGPADEEQPFGNTVAYAGWSDDRLIFDGALNKEKLQNQDGTHFPVFKMDTLEEFEQFKSQYGDIFTMDQGFNDVLSFDAAVAKAQWDREAFYEKHSLLVIYIPANSGSFRYHVNSVDVADGSVRVNVSLKNDPENIVTMDMAGWFVLMELDDEEACNYTSFDAVLSD